MINLLKFIGPIILLIWAVLAAMARIGIQITPVTVTIVAAIGLFFLIAAFIARDSDST